MLFGLTGNAPLSLSLSLSLSLCDYYYMTCFIFVEIQVVDYCKILARENRQ